MANNAIVGTLRAILSASTAEFEAAMAAAANSAKSWSKDLNKLGRDATAVGTALTKTLTLPIAGIATVAAKAATDFESSFTGVRKTVDATAAEFAVMAQQFRDLAKIIPVNVNDLNKIGEAAGQLGIRKENILAFTEVMAKLGVTTNLAGDEAATLLARFDNITTGGAQQTFAELGATIVGLGNNLATTESEIGQMALRLAGAGTQIGLTQADILSLGGALSSLGLEAEAGGTAFSRVMIEMQNAVLDGGEKLQVFNDVVRDDFVTLFKTDAAEAINAFIGGLARMSEEGQNINPVLDDLGLGGIRVSDALRRTGNAVERVSEAVKLGREEWSKGNALNDEAAKRFETTAAQLTLLKNQLTDVAISLGNALLPVIKNVAAFMRDTVVPALESAVSAFTSLPTGVQTAAVAFGALLAALGPVVFVFGQIISASGAVVGAFAAQGIATRGLAAATAALSGSATVLVGALGSVAVAIAGWSLGRAIGEATGLTDKIKDLTVKLYALDQAFVPVDQQARIVRAAISQGADASITYAEALEFLKTKAAALRAEWQTSAATQTRTTDAVTTATTASQSHVEAVQEETTSLRKLATALDTVSTKAKALSAVPLVTLPEAADVYSIIDGLHGISLEGSLATLQARQLTDAFQTLGVTSQASLDAMAQKARDAYATIARSGTATADDLVAAANAVAEANAKAARESSESFHNMFTDIYDAFSDFGSKIGGFIENTVGGPIGTALSGIAGGIIANIASLIVSGISSMLAAAANLVFKGLAAIGRAIGNFFSGLFGGNDTKDAREQFARSLGYGNLDALYNVLPEDLRNQGLNIIGRNDRAANEQWMRDVQAWLDAHGYHPGTGQPDYGLDLGGGFGFDPGQMEIPRFNRPMETVTRGGLAILDRGDLVGMPGAETGGPIGGGGTAVLELDSRTLVEVLVPQMAGAVRRYALTRV